MTVMRKVASYIGDLRGVGTFLETELRRIKVLNPLKTPL